MRIHVLSAWLIAIMFATLIMPAYAATFTFSSSGDGSAGWSTEQAYSGSQSAKLNSGTGGGASAGKVSMPYAQTLSSITTISFWYRISSASTAIPFGEMNAGLGRDVYKTSTGETKQNILYVGVGGGAAFFLADNFALEGMLLYDFHRQKNIATDGINKKHGLLLKFGFTFFFSSILQE